jgi:nucleotide-binding universal stress UspA family protein
VAPAPDDIYEQRGPAVAYLDQAMARLEAEATDYLRGVGAGLGDVPLQTAVRFGDVAAGILREASSFEADLLVLAACGCGGLAQPALGRVATEVFRRAAVPVVIWRPGRDEGRK